MACSHVGCAGRPMPNRRRRVRALATACWVSDYGLVRRNASPTVTGSSGVLNEVYPSKRRDPGLAAIGMLRSATRHWNRSPARRQNPGANAQLYFQQRDHTACINSTPNGRECLNADQITHTALQAADFAEWVCGSYLHFQFAVERDLSELARRSRISCRNCSGGTKKGFF
jgi:hypothetical protein